MSMKVLISDPDWRFVRVASEFLESHAHLVVRSPRCDQALEVAQSWEPDLVIVSEELTETNLLEDLQKLPNRPAVLLVGWMDNYARLWRAWQKGGDELLMKPFFHIRELHTAIVVALENATTGARGRSVAISA